MDRLLTPVETGDRLRCSLPKVHAMSSTGALAKYKLGGRLFFKESDIEAYIEANRVEAREPVVV